MTIDRSQVRKILIIQPGGIGDIILTTIAIDNLLDEFPGAVIDYLIREPLHRPFLEQPFIHEILTFSPKKRFSGIKVIAEARKRSYDLVIDFFSNPRTALITFLSGARYRAGRSYRGRRYAYNFPIRNTSPGPAHQAERNLDFLAQMGLQHFKTDLHFEIGGKERESAGRFWSATFGEHEFVVGMLPSGSWQSKKCDPEKLAEIADAVIERFNTRIVLIWAPSEEQETRLIQDLMNHDPVLAPPTSVTEMAALVSRCGMVISNDSGPMHIAAAVGTPVLSLHGPTNPRRQGPYGPKHEGLRLEELPCIGCHQLVCAWNHECFRNIPLDMVLEKVQNMITRNKLIPPVTIIGAHD